MCVAALYWNRPYSQYYKKTTPLAVLGLLWTGAGLGGLLLLRISILSHMIKKVKSRPASEENRPAERVKRGT